MNNKREGIALTLKEHFELLGYDVTYYNINDDYNLFIKDSTSRFDKKISVSVLKMYDEETYILVQCKCEEDIEIDGPVSTSELENLVQSIEEMLL